jgi:hypothetical protein
MEPMNAMSVITLMPTKKEELKSFVVRASEEILSGDYNPLTVETYLKFVEDAVKEIRENIRQKVIDECMKYGKEDIVVNNCKVSLSQRKMYDYSGDAYIAKRKEEIKERENFLKTLEDPQINENTGEVSNPVPYKTSDIVTIKY